MKDVAIGIALHDKKKRLLLRECEHTWIKNYKWGGGGFGGPNGMKLLSNAKLSFAQVAGIFVRFRGTIPNSLDAFRIKFEIKLTSRRFEFERNNVKLRLLYRILLNSTREKFPISEPHNELQLGAHASGEAHKRDSVAQDIVITVIA